MTAIERRALGDSGVMLPRVALGCGNFGGVGSAPAFFGQGQSEDEAFALMDAAWELGLHHFDTADAYGGGRSETAIGKWIAARGVRPTLTTKTYNPMDEGADHGLAPERIERQLASSLERLGVDRVELYLAHDFDPDVPARDETMDAFEAQLGAGRIRAYGVSNFDAAQLDGRARRRHARSRSRTRTRCSIAATRPSCCRCATRAASRTWRSARSPAAG